MDKTPGQIARDAWHTKADLHERWDYAAAAVIAHVTPQIRAAAIEDCIALVKQPLCYHDKQELLVCTLFRGHDGKCVNSLVSLSDRIRALAPLPPGHVCVPITQQHVIDGAVSELWQAIGQYSVQVSETKECAPPDYLSDAVIKLRNLIAAAKEPK